MVTMSLGTLAVTLLATLPRAVVAATLAQESRGAWMGRQFEALKSRTLMEITLPGSHNSGNYLGALSPERPCTSDYGYYNGYRAAAVAAGVEPLTQQGFDERMIPWNVNHFRPISQQLRTDGARYFHLKICNFGRPGSQQMDLASVHFQHRGYTTKETLASTIEDLKAFLAEHPHEVVVLGFNNLHNSMPGGFGDADVLALSSALHAALGPGMLVGREDLFNSTLGELIGAGKRVVVFMGGSNTVAGRLPPGIIPSSEALAEDWDDIMASGNLEGSSKWLVKDVHEQATQRGRFYVMQANPNNDEELMYKAIISGKGPQSNEAFLDGFLRGLPSLVSGALAMYPAARINAVSSDFLNISQTFEIAMNLMGPEIFM